MEGNKNITEGANLQEREKSFEILSKSLQESIKQIVKNEGYETYSVEAREFNPGGGSFMSQCYEVDIKGETNEGVKETNIFIKQILNLAATEFISIDVAYTKEAFVYTNLSKVIASLQERAGVPEHDRYKITKAYDQTNTEAIIMENLNKKNFKSYGKIDIVPLKYVELALQQVAKLHALSFVIENEMPEYFNENIKPLPQTLHFDEEWKQLVRNVCKGLGNLYDDVIKTKLENFLPNILEKYPKYNDHKTNFKRCFIHADYRTNNVLVREHNGEPVEVMPIDYQLIDYGCPIRDFIYSAFMGTDRKFRQRHLNDLKNLYFDTLSRFLKYFDMDVETVFPREEFERVYTEWLDYGLMTILIYSPFLLYSETEMNLERIQFSETPCNPDEYAQKRLKELLEEFIEWGYL